MRAVLRKIIPVTILCASITLGLCQCSSTTGGHVANIAKNQAILIQGRAIAPSNAPAIVKEAVAAGNRINGLPYRRGGGHGTVEDSAYDCSGTVSYVLHHAGLLNQPETSSGLKHFGEKGEGKYITIYAKDGHAFMVVAGLRLDTGWNRGRAEHGPRWTTDDRPLKGFEARHPEGL